VFSGLFFASFVSVFLDVGHRRKLSEGWWIRYSMFLVFQTAPLYLLHPFSEFLGGITGFFHFMKHRFFQKEAEICQLTYV